MTMNTERAAFGARLRAEREARALSIPDVVKVTKIPERSVIALENGSFEELPADVFVRGFIRSYCKSVGLDVEEILASYQEIVAAGAAKKREPPSLAKLAPSRDAASAPPPPATAAAPAAPAQGGGEATGPGDEPSPEEAEARKEEATLFALLASAGRSTSRASLTIAVVILVIVATLTLSLLLRRPGHIGDGVSSVSA